MARVGHIHVGRVKLFLLQKFTINTGEHCLVLFSARALNNLSLHVGRVKHFLLQKFSINTGEHCLVLFSARSLNNLSLYACWASEALFVAKVYSKHGRALLRVVQCESSQ